MRPTCAQDSLCQLCRQLEAGTQIGATPVVSGRTPGGTQVVEGTQGFISPMVCQRIAQV